MNARSAARTTLLALVSLVVLATPAAAGEPVSACGTLEALERPNGMRGVAGSAIIDGHLYRLSPSRTEGPSVISRQATVGNHVCLTGEREGTALTTYTIAGCGSATPLAGCESAPLSLDAPTSLLGAAVGAGALTVIGSALLGSRNRRPARVPLRGLSTARHPVPPAIAHRAEEPLSRAS